MKPFDYISVDALSDACGVLAEHGADACILAGGTDLLIEWRRPSAKPPKIVLDISRVPELGGITESDGTITIRPLATHADLLRSDIVRQFAPLLGAAAATIGSPQIRGRGTVGGNVMNAAACADTVPPLIAKATKKKLDHFSMDGYPFGGEHATSIGNEIRVVLAIDGNKKATMPSDKPGSVTGDDLAAIKAWTEAWLASGAAGNHPIEPPRR